MRLLIDNMFDTPNTPIKITRGEYEALLPKVATIVEQLNKGEGDNKDKEIPMVGWQDYANNLSDKDINAIKTAAQKLANNSDVVYVVGIGGSYLGPRAVIEAIYGRNFNDVINPKIYFIGCDTDPDYFNHCLKMGAGKRVGAIVISKSGTTTEPALAFRFVKALIEKQHGAAAKDQIIAVTDEKKGALRKLADQNGYTTFVIPDNVGGRFSVITPVGLVAIALSGIDISEYIAGYKSIKPSIDSTDMTKNLAAQYAALRYIAWQKGAVVEYQVTNSAFFESNIFWTMQLEPESEGHKGKGLHVVPAVFPRDLHSIGQLIQQGPRNLIEIFTKVMNAHTDLQVPADAADLDDLNYLVNNKLTLNDINRMTVDGPMAAHVADGVPAMVVELDTLTPKSLGEYHYMLMKATGIQGYLLGHNPFIQPGVQFWKDKLFTLAGKPGYKK